MYAEDMKKKIAKYFQKKISCKIAYEIKINSSVLDMLILTYNTRTKKIYKLIGVEIKSDKDNLSRLRHQLRDYYKTCDKVFLAVGFRVNLQNLPLGLGILRVTPKEVIEEVRPMDIGKFHLKHDIPIKVVKKTLNASNLEDNNSNLLLKYIQIIEDVRKKLWFNKLFGKYWDDDRLYKKRLTNKDMQELTPFTKEELAVINRVLKEKK